jgi:hypothetical protein
MAQSDRGVLDWIRALLGYGTIYEQSLSTLSFRACYTLKISKNADREHFLRGVRPYLHVKSAQVDAALIVLDRQREELKHKFPRRYATVYRVS